MNDDRLFWYPDRKYKDDEYDKELMLIHEVNYWLNRLQSMFKYEGLPDTIPAKWLEHYLLCNGSCIIAKDDEGRLIAYLGAQGTKHNVYYIPCGYIVSNPYFNKGIITTTDDVTNSEFSKTFLIGTDCEIIYNDVYSEGVMPLLYKYCRQMVENYITMDIADILTRAMLIITSADDKTRASAELFLQRLREGKLSTIATNAFIEGLNLQGFDKLASCLTNLIEYHQYIKAGLFNELGLNSNYNMKRESINSNESQLNDDMLHPLIDTMLRERQEGIDRVNKMFDLDIKVTFNSAWLANEIEEEATHDLMTAQTLIAEEEAIIPLTEGAEDVDNSTDIDTSTDSMDTEDNVEVTEDEDISDDTTSDVSGTDSVDNGTGQLTDDDIKSASDLIESIEEVIEEVQDTEDEEEKEVEEDGTSND